MTDRIRLEDCKDFINKNYVEKLLKFLRGEATSAASKQEYMKVYDVIIHHVNVEDTQEYIY